METNLTHLLMQLSLARADQIIESDPEFQYDELETGIKRQAIAANLKRAVLAAGSKGLEHIWKSGTLNKYSKAHLVNGLKDMDTKEADDALAPVWDRMDDDHKDMHLNNHPKSRHAVLHSHQKKAAKRAARTEVEEHAAREETHIKHMQANRRRNDRLWKAEQNKGKEEIGDGEWWHRLKPHQQAKYLSDHPRSKKSRHFRKEVRHEAKKVAAQIHSEVPKIGSDFKKGMEGVRELRTGGEMSDEQWEGLKKTTTKVSTLLLGALGGIALFTPLGPLAMQVGSEYLNSVSARADKIAAEHREGRETDDENDGEGDNTNNSKHSNVKTTVGAVKQKSQSGTNLHRVHKELAKEHEDDNAELAWLQRDMTNWLCKVDTTQLVKRIYHQNPELKPKTAKKKDA